MRKVTQEICRAFINREDKRIGNSETFTYHGSNRHVLKLHNNEIAMIDEGQLWITNAHWSSMTTKERLNGLPGVHIVQKSGTWYLNGREWDGSWIKVS